MSHKIRSSRPEVFCKKSVIRNCSKFTGKHLCQSLFLNKVAGPISKNTFFSQNTSGDWFCKMEIRNHFFRSKVSGLECLHWLTVILTSSLITRWALMNQCVSRIILRKVSFYTYVSTLSLIILQHQWFFYHITHAEIYTRVLISSFKNSFIMAVVK